MVADPPRLAQKISAKITGTGLNFSVFPSSTVTAAKNKITVIESMNMARIADINMKTRKIFEAIYLTHFARRRHSH